MKKRSERSIYAEIASRRGKSLLAQVLKAQAMIEEMPKETRKTLGLDFDLIAVDEFCDVQELMMPTMHNAHIHQIEAQIRAHEGAIKNISEALEYADGPAYYTDRRIRDQLQRDLLRWRDILEIAKEQQRVQKCRNQLTLPLSTCKGSDSTEC